MEIQQNHMDGIFAVAKPNVEITACYHGNDASHIQGLDRAVGTSLTCYFFISSAHLDSGHDGVQEELASLPPGKASHQLHGCQTVREVGRSTHSGRRQMHRGGALLCFSPAPSSSPLGRLSPDRARVCVCVFAQVRL